MAQTDITNVLPCDPSKAKEARAKRQEPFGLITAGYMVHYTGPGQRPATAQVGFDRRVHKPEQVYERDILVGTEAQPIDCGWIKEPGMLLVVNKAAKGSGLRIIMSVGGVPFAQAISGEAIPPFHPVLGSTSKLTLVSTGEDTPVTVYAFPG